MSLYRLKPQFQAMLRPFVSKLAQLKISANTVTLSSALLSLLFGGFLYITDNPIWFALLPLVFLLRMALNAIDGMLAREHNQITRLGGHLNELTDVVSDAALYLPFALIAPLQAGGVALVIWLSALSEMSGLLGATAGGARRYEGPMGKSDRAFIFSLLGLYYGFFGTLPEIFSWVMPILSLLLVLTIGRRIIVDIQTNKCSS